MNIVAFLLLTLSTFAGADHRSTSSSHPHQTSCPTGVPGSALVVPADRSAPLSEEQNQQPSPRPVDGAADPQAAAAPSATPAQSEIRTVPSRWRSFDPSGQNPEYIFRIYDPYHQNLLKADFPLAGNWFLELNALNTFVYKARRNLDFSNVFADQISLGNLEFHSHNHFRNENLIFGLELRRFDDTFFPSDFRIRLNGVFDYRADLNAFLRTSNVEPFLFDAFVDVKLHDFGGDEDGRDNFDLLFLRGGFQGFRSDFHGLVFNDVGLGGRLFGEFQRNRFRYDFLWLKLFQKDPATGFLSFSRPSAHQVAIGRFTWEDFLVLGWNSEWSVHYNRERRKIGGGPLEQQHDTFYWGATFNGQLGRVEFNPAFYAVHGNADQVVGGVPVEHSVAAFLVLLDVRYPFDYWKFRAGYLFASGDGNPADRRDTGFDAISDSIVLFGGPLSYWTGENIRFGRGDFVRANSVFPSLRGANEPANYINPGIQILNVGLDVVLSPRLEFSGNVNYLRFVSRGAYTNRVVIRDLSAGLEENFFLRIKPFLREVNQNVLLDVGFSVLHAQPGLQSAFQTTRGTVYSNFLALRLVY
ncbi:MAG: hypothetical protein K6U02_00815 [Firmicutes bacterium]|nr:hypothetical protein [Bacillota bacterium]